MTNAESQMTKESPVANAESSGHPPVSASGVRHSAMSDEPQVLREIPPPWLAFGPEKDDWKQSGNRYTAEELRNLEADARELRITDCPDILLSAD